MVTSPGFHPAGQTSSGFSCTYCTACRVRTVSSTLRPKDRLLMVECWMIPCTAEARRQSAVSIHRIHKSAELGIESSTFGTLHGTSNDVKPFGRYVVDLHIKCVPSKTKQLARCTHRVFINIRKARRQDVNDTSIKNQNFKQAVHQRSITDSSTYGVQAKCTSKSYLLVDDEKATKCNAILCQNIVLFADLPLQI